MRSDDQSPSPQPMPIPVRFASVFVRIESVAWMLLGTLLIVGGLIVLDGGSGLPGIVNDPVGDPPIGAWAVGVGIAIAVMASWGMWTGWSMRRRSRGSYVSALLFCAVWILLGLVWISIATSLIPGVVTILVNVGILVALATPPSRSAFRMAAEAGNAAIERVKPPT